jgi:hypothetical protein
MIGEFWIWLIIFVVLVFIILGVTLFFKNKSESPAGDYTLSINIVDKDIPVVLYLGVEISTEITIDWGDGTEENVTVPVGVNPFSHSYTEENKSFNITLKNASNLNAFANYDIVSPTPTPPSSGVNKITSANVSNLTNLVYLLFPYTDLTTVNISGLNKLRFVGFKGSKLTVNSVNELIVTFNIFGTFPIGGDEGLYLDSQNPVAIPTTGPPNGVAAKSALQGRGWTVETD